MAGKDLFELIGLVVCRHVRAGSVSGLHDLERVIAGGRHRRVLLLVGAIRCIFAVAEDVLVCESHRSKVGDVIMPVNFLIAAVLVAEVAAFAVWAELLSVELSTVLGLVLIVQSLLLFIYIELMILTELVETVCELALGAISAQSSLAPVLAKLALIHGSLHEAPLVHVVGVLAGAVHLLTDDWGNHVCLANWHKSR